MSTSSRWLHAALFLVFTASCLIFAALAFAYLYQGFNPRNPFHLRFAEAGWAVPGHFFAAGLALALAPLQASAWVRRRWPAVHRTGGWLSVAAIAIGGVSGLLLAPGAQGGLPNAINFALLSVLWLLFTGAGVYFALAGDFQRHRRWMLRSLALTFAAVTLRAYLGLGLLAGLPFAVAYTSAAWLCWTVNLIALECWLRRRPKNASGAAKRPPAAPIGSCAQRFSARH